MGALVWGVMKLTVAIQTKKATAFRRIYLIILNREIERAEEVRATTAKQISGAQLMQAAGAAYACTSLKRGYAAKYDLQAAAAAEAMLIKIRASESGRAVGAISALAFA
jgi:hypothetical protein